MAGNRRARNAVGPAPNQGRAICLNELNPAGQFLYLDRLAGTNLVAVMSRAVSSKNSAPFLDLGFERRFSFLIVDVPASYQRNLLRDCHLAGTFLL